MKKLLCKGDWWLPDQPTNKVAGTLSFCQRKGARLELFGTFAGFDNFSWKHDNIYGRVEMGRRVTLDDCLLSRISESDSIYIANSVFFGDHIERGDATGYTGIQLAFPSLYRWMQSKTQLEQSPVGGTSKGQYSISYPKDGYRISFCHDGNNVGLSLSARVHLGFPEASIREKAHCTVDFAEPKSYSEISNSYIVPIRNFVCFATGEPNHIKSLYLLRKDQPPVQAFHRQAYYHKRAKRKERHWSTMLIHFPEVEEGLSEIICRWLELSWEMEVVMKLFAMEQMASGLPLQVRFTTLCQALERFHPYRFEGSKDAVKYGALLRVIENSLPCDVSSWVVGILREKTGKSLSQRFQDLITGRDGLLKPLVTDVEAFMKTVKQARNFFTHFSNPKHMLDGMELVLTVEVLSLLLKSLFLSELGFSVVQQAEIFRSTQEIEFIRNNRFVISEMLRRRSTSTPDKKIPEN